MMKIEKQLDPNRQYVIGTAGHIDHGKTALVKALTGVDTDRLPEEKERGITIDLGFAHLTENVTIIDVPGHERLIKNMVAGVSTIDLVLFTIAADDGIMPQTLEHLDIVRLLDIRHGIFTITKIDLVDEEWLQMVEEEIRSLLKNSPFQSAPVVRTSVVTGEGIEELRRLIFEKLSAIPPRQDVEIFRLPVDRVFSVKGFGTVVTGTVLSGKKKVGDSVEIQPSGISTRIRGLQTHGKDTETVQVGYRAAVNLAGVEIQQVNRGDVLVEPQFFQPVRSLNVRFTLLNSAPKPLKNFQRIRLHIHTQETFARIILPQRKELLPGESALVQIHLEQPVHAAFQDRFIVRQYSPQHTLGGGVVLQMNSFKYRKRFHQIFLKQLKNLEGDDPAEKLLATFDVIHLQPQTRQTLKAATNFTFADLDNWIKKLMKEEQLFELKVLGKPVYVSVEQIKRFWERAQRIISAYHKKYPGRPGIPEAELTSQLESYFQPELIPLTLNWAQKNQKLVIEKKFYRLPDFKPQISDRQAALMEAIEKRLSDAHTAPPTLKELADEFQLSSTELNEILNQLKLQEKIIFIGENFVFSQQAIQSLRKKVRAHFARQETLSVPEFKELIQATRKHAIPLLEYFDNQHWTVREGNVRKAGSRLMG